MEENKKIFTDKEKIEKIELAPVEMQTMVAKAFIREDIADEDVQYTFNTDSLELLNEDGTIENLNGEELEGIGATGNFSIRTSKPGAGNKHYIRTASGGWSTCIKGNPQDSQCDVLANCVGYAQGRFNEIYNEIKGTSGNRYNTLNCNAENWIERARAAGLEIGSTPREGAIICWMKGNSLSSGDGAGHVAIVEKVYDSNHIYTSESGYGSAAFWNQHRYNNNGRWGCGSSYSLRGFIYNPAVTGGSNPSASITPSATGKFNIGDKVIINGPLYVSSDAAYPTGNVYNKVTTITRKVMGTKHPYNTTGDLGWMDESSISKYNQPAPTPVPTPAPSTGLSVGDTVKIIGTGNGSSYGRSNTAYGIGWTRQILNIWAGRPYPYQVGNNTGTTGFYKAEALQKK